jgi:hypothetical protein
MTTSVWCGSVLSRLNWALAVLAVAIFCTPTLALATQMCPPGTGKIDRWPLFLGAGLTVVLVLVFLVFLRKTPNKPPRHGARLAVVVLAMFSSCGACSTLTCGLFTCPPNTQEPEVLCDHFEALADESTEPVGFDHAACLQAWQEEQQERSSWSYRELSSCARGMLRDTLTTDCKAEGFALERHAPGQWPAPPAKAPAPTAR